MLMRRARISWKKPLAKNAWGTRKGMSGEEREVQELGNNKVHPVVTRFLHTIHSGFWLGDITLAVR